MGDTIVTKQTASNDTTCSQPRPDGSSAGITALENAQTLSGSPCVDFATSSRGRSSSDPTTISFINLAGDAVTYATQPGSHAPAALTAADLTGIYSCTITKWSQIPGDSGGSGATNRGDGPAERLGHRAVFSPRLGYRPRHAEHVGDAGRLRPMPTTTPSSRTRAWPRR